MHLASVQLQNGTHYAGNCERFWNGVTRRRSHLRVERTVELILSIDKSRARATMLIPVLPLDVFIIAERKTLAEIVYGAVRGNLRGIRRNTRAGSALFFLTVV